SMQFAAGTYNIAKGIISEGGSTTRFGAGTYRVGRADIDCHWRGGRFSLCDKGNELSFDGPSTFELAGGIHSGGSLPLRLGSGTTNSFRIGPSSKGMAILLEGGAATAVLSAAT